MSITTSPFSALALLELRQQLLLWPDGLRNGSLRSQDADQGLLVAWGGVNQPARREMRSQSWNPNRSAPIRFGIEQKKTSWSAATDTVTRLATPVKWTGIKAAVDKCLKGAHLEV
ncbi:hypothetical protein [Candidatus Poriferisodalis sp.]|uniref:hypothetical protein n=1 Tax=Candidatus Poriferisodalis sp. TaxID=3101277 RepID=UPI003C6F9280